MGRWKEKRGRATGAGRGAKCASGKPLLMRWQPRVPCMTEYATGGPTSPPRRARLARPRVGSKGFDSRPQSRGKPVAPSRLVTAMSRDTGTLDTSFYRFSSRPWPTPCLIVSDDAETDEVESVRYGHGKRPACPWAALIQISAVGLASRQGKAAPKLVGGGDSIPFRDSG